MIRITENHIQALFEPITSIKYNTQIFNIVEKLIGDGKKCICGHQYRHIENNCSNCRYCNCTEFRCDSEKIQWKLFLDDERDPIDDTWVICRSINDVIRELDLRGFPNTVQFDHDLGTNTKFDNRYDNSGMGVAYYLIDQILDKRFTLPNNFTWYVHSQNPVGVENINSLMNNFVSNFKG